MARSPLRRRLRRLRSGRAAALAAALLLSATPAAAVPVGLVLDEGQSGLAPAPGPGAALSGTLALELGSLPPLASSTPFDVVGLDVSGGGLEVALDGNVPGPGLGLLRPDGSFEIPSLFLTVTSGGLPTALTVLDVTGTFGASGACGGVLCLETSFDVDTLGPEGVVGVVLVAAVPEPASAALLSLGVGLLAAARRARRSA